jgi:hypothetical protein
LASLSVSGGTTDINGKAVTTSGTQSYNDIVVTPAATLTTANNNVSINGTTTLTAGLTISDGTGNATFTGTVDGPGSLAVMSAGTTTFTAAGLSRASRFPAAPPISTAVRSPPAARSRTAA